MSSSAGRAEIRGSSQEQVVDAFNRVFTVCQQRYEPALAYLKSGGEVPDYDTTWVALRYHMAAEGVREVTGRIPKIGEPALSLGRATYTWPNFLRSVEVDPGTQLFQKEGIPMEGVLVVAKAESRTLYDILKQASRPYRLVHEGQPHAMAGRFYEERVRQEAYFRSTQPWGERGTSYRDSQNWLWAEWIIGNRLELVVPQQ